MGQSLRTGAVMLAAVLRASAAIPSNENKMSDGGRGRASLGVEVWKSSQNADA